jgi:hypothetical protein
LHAPEARAKLEFPIEVQGTGPYMFSAHRPGEGEFLDIRPTLLYLDRKLRINSLQKLYWEQAQDVSKQRPNKNRALEQHVLSSIRGILDMLKVPGDEIDDILRKIKK